jgi:hypothetical protein
MDQAEVLLCSFSGVALFNCISLLNIKKEYYK